MHEDRPLTSSEAELARCAGCGHDVRDLPPDAAFCPTCGKRVRTAHTAWTTLTGFASRLFHGPDDVVVERGPRAPVVVGYSNALWRLGWRYEHGWGAMRNVPEAMRCYRKSAGLGNVEAQARVAPLPVIPLPPDDADDATDGHVDVTA